MAAPVIRLGPEDQLACFDNRAHRRRVKQIHLLRGGERECGWRGDADMMTFSDVIRRHESIKQRILFLRTRRCRVAVAKPRDADIRAIRGRDNSNAGR